MNSAPILTVDWNAADGQKWKVPFGAGAGKLLFLGKLPLNVQVGAYKYVVKPDVGPDWQLRLQAQFLFPKPGGDLKVNQRPPSGSNGRPRRRPWFPILSM